MLEQGRLVASGTHDELLRRSPHYRRIFARYDVDLPPLEVEELQAAERVTGDDADAVRKCLLACGSMLHPVVYVGRFFARQRGTTTNKRR